MVAVYPLYIPSLIVGEFTAFAAHRLHILASRAHFHSPLPLAENGHEAPHSDARGLSRSPCRRGCHLTGPRGRFAGRRGSATRPKSDSPGPSTRPPGR